MILLCEHVCCLFFNEVPKFEVTIDGVLTVAYQESLKHSMKALRTMTTDMTIWK